MSRMIRQRCIHGLVLPLCSFVCAQIFAQPIFIETLGGGQGSADGQFDSPHGLALDAAGNLYIADLGNERVQRFDNSAGALTHGLSFGTAGSDNGQFNGLVGIAVDPTGNVFTVERDNHRVQKFTPGVGTLQHDFSTGSFGALPGQFDQPSDIAIDSTGDIYIVEQNNARMQVFAQGTGLLNPVTTFNAGGQLVDPSGVTVTDDGTIYVVDAAGSQMWSAQRLGSVVGQTGSATTTPQVPTDVAVGTDGSVYLALNMPASLDRFAYDGSSLAQLNSYTGPAANPVANPTSVAADALGNIYLADAGTHRVTRLFDPAAIAPGNTGQLENLLLGASGQQFTMTLDADRGLNVTGTTIVEPEAFMTILSDQFNSQNLGIFGGTYHGRLAGVGSLSFLSGTLTVTDDAGLTIDSAGVTGGLLEISSLKTLNVNNALIIDATGTLTLSGGAVSADTLMHDGALSASGATLTLRTSGSAGTGTMDLTTGGLRLTNSYDNSGVITVTDSVLRVDGAFTQTTGARIDASGLTTLRFGGGATNDGDIAITGGDTIITGDINNTATGVIELASTNASVFSGLITNDGTITIGAESQADFDGGYRGIGSITGSGTSRFNASLLPGGDETASINIAGNAELLTALTVQIGGTTPGAAFDQILIGGTATLAGTLTIELIDDYQPRAGETFVIIEAGTLGEAPFDTINGLTFAPGLTFTIDYDTTLNRIVIHAPNTPLGDTDMDGDIDDTDLGVMISNFTGPDGTGQTLATGDTDMDGDVDDTDLGIAISGFTGPLAPASVPEPGSLLAVVCAMLIGLPRRAVYSRSLRR